MTMTMTMSQGRQLYKRRNYLIKKDFQLKFILKFCLLLFIGVVISTVLLFLFCQDTLTSSFQQSRLVIENTGLAILPSVVYTNLITLGLIALATITVTLFVSHKIAGPMFRFQKELEDVGKGNLTRKVTFRSKDQIGDMAVSLNNMIGSLHEKVLDIQTEVERIRKLASGQDVPTGLIEELNHLYKKIGRTFEI
jgi:methyl-accepting chemotaxis protein